MSLNRCDKRCRFFFDKLRCEQFNLAAENRACSLEVRLQGEVHILIEVVFKYHSLNIQFLFNERSEVSDQRFVFSVNENFRKRLSYLDSFLFTGSASERNECSYDVHSLFYALVNEIHVCLREVCYMNGFFAGKVCVDFVCDERRNRSDEAADAYEDFVSGCIYALLVIGHFFRIESAARSSDIPVGKVFGNKIRNRSYRLHVVVLIHVLGHIVNELVVFAENPSVKLRSLCIRNIEFSRVDVVLVCVKNEEIIYISECSEEFAYNIAEAFFVEFRRCPCRRYGKQIPSGSVCAVFVEHFKRRYGVAFVL